MGWHLHLVLCILGLGGYLLSSFFAVNWALPPLELPCPITEVKSLPVVFLVCWNSHFFPQCPRIVRGNHRLILWQVGLALPHSIKKKEIDS